MSSKNNNWIEASIIDDSEDEIEYNNDNSIIEEPEVFDIIPVKKNHNPIIEHIVQKRKRNIQLPLKHFYNNDINIIEIGIDEAGRGPMFGRVYAGVVILPKDDTYNHSLMKDSKKFHSKKKIEEVAEYIKENAIAWSVDYEDEGTIDEINILQATQSAMHKCIKKLLKKNPHFDINKILLLVDGNYFKPLNVLNNTKTKLETLKYELIEGGDNKYSSIAAASILAKVERDKYIEQLCLENPELIEKYGIDSNKGYGSKKHMEGIKKFGITKWHRKSFGICKEYVA